MHANECRCLGVISGMTGSGGTIGAVVTELVLFSGWSINSNMSTQTSISLMGVMMLLSTIPLALLYFPQSGGMFCGPSTTTSHLNPTQQEDSYDLLA